MKRILIFNDTLKYGGTEALLIDVLRHLSTKDCRVTLLLPFPSESDILLKDVPSQIQVKYIYPEQPSRAKKIVCENMMSFCPRRHNKAINLDLKEYDLLVSFKDSIYSVLFSKEKQRKILWIHNLPAISRYEIKNAKEYIPIKLLQTRIKRLIRSFRRFDELVCVSQACLDRYIDVFNNGKPPKQNLRVIHNAIDIEKTHELSTESVNFNFEHPVFISVTRFSTEKRVDRIIKATHRLKTEGYRFHTIIIGDGTYRKQSEEMIAELSLYNDISLLGYIKNPCPYIKQSDWLICSSEKESFSLVLLDAIALGTPVITTDCGGPTEITENGKYGILTDNSSQGIYEGMKKALDSPHLAEAYKAKADECLKRFDYKKWLAAVDDVLGLAQ